MSFNKEVQFRVRRRAGFVPRGSWIANVKEQLGIPLRRAPNRDGERKHRCHRTSETQSSKPFEPRWLELPDRYWDRL
jgi:hypothetical protein